MHDAIAEARMHLIRARDFLVQALETTPEDRLGWSPSPTCRTPVEIAGHAADAIGNIRDTLGGRPMDVGSSAEAEALFREADRHYTTREQVLGLLERNVADYLELLDGLTPERLDEIIRLPFHLGTAPLSVALAFAPTHTLCHAAQIAYVQTIYGDRDWHV